MNHNARPVLFPYTASESTMRFCRTFSRNNMARVGEIEFSARQTSSDPHFCVVFSFTQTA